MVGGFGKTQARVDEYFALKKTEADWAWKWARPAGSEGPRLQNKRCSKIQDKIENGQVRVPSGGLVHESSRRIYQNHS